MEFFEITSLNQRQSNLIRKCLAQELFILVDWGIGFLPANIIPHITKVYCDSSRLVGDACWYCFDDESDKKRKGYKQWFSVFEDYSGSFFNVYYPFPVPEAGEMITIKHSDGDITGDITWKQGTPGLVKSEILKFVWDIALRHNGEDYEPRRYVRRLQKKIMLPWTYDGHPMGFS
jgi:hypothetical protein